MQSYTPPPMPQPSPPAESDQYRVVTQTVRQPRTVTVCVVITAICAVLAVGLLATIRSSSESETEASTDTMTSDLTAIRASTETMSTDLTSIRASVETMATDLTVTVANPVETVEVTNVVETASPRDSSLYGYCFPNEVGGYEINVVAFSGGIEKTVASGSYGGDLTASFVGEQIGDYYYDGGGTVHFGSASEDCHHLDGWGP